MLRLHAAVLTLAVGVDISAAPPPKVILLIGGDAPHNPNVHESAQAVERLATDLFASPSLRGKVSVRSYPLGWPTDPSAFTNVATVVLYFDGLERHPLLDPARRDAFAALMARGVGLVAFHQASTLPLDDHSVPLATWLGGIRHGMVDRTVERVRFVPARHPIANGVGSFTYRDEFYPSLSWRAGITPILRAKLHLEAAPTLPPTLRTVAWSYRRTDGGRAFGFTGFHYLDTLDQPAVRRMMLNGIVWTAGLSVPVGGVQ